ncbi:hypothetical protein PFICI_05439 [Pestalotiopsis fici W106-1]|uniref:Uncharacterized protein n=1 Tax=Pestalotiopsis fici (strain W106-1 / CGMCC3.15140) TaxID=1229662 RepID=W3XBU9_PESFW|nr:uncharacterized protein PFICI_05439 [Pestalotiopsis fici W106-1]ETS83563.1 hypothetical protein PFICI_05439 [Pestalotiopsis fici W106-1]
MDWLSCFYRCPHTSVESVEAAEDTTKRMDLTSWYQRDCIHCDFNILDLSVRELHAESPELERALPTSAWDDEVRREALVAADWGQLGDALWYSLLPTDGPVTNITSEQNISNTEVKNTLEKDLPSQSQSNIDDEEDEDTEEGGAKLW